MSQAGRSVSLRASGLYSSKLKPLGGGSRRRARAPIAGDRVGQTARRPHHRHRAVFQAVKLVQAAGLEAAGHEKHVGPGLDAMGQRVGKLQPHGDLVADSAGQDSRTGGDTSAGRCRGSPIARRSSAPNAGSLRRSGRSPSDRSAGRRTAIKRHVGATGQPQLLLQRRLAERLARAPRSRHRSCAAGADRWPDSTRRRPCR